MEGAALHGLSPSDLHRVSELQVRPVSQLTSAHDVSLCVSAAPINVQTNVTLHRHDEIIQREAEKDEEMKTVETVTGSTFRRKRRGL